MLERNIGKSGLTKPVVIPKVTSIKQFENNENSELNTISGENDDVAKQKQNKLDQSEIENILQSVETDISEKNEVEEPEKKRRGRPKKVVQPVTQESSSTPKEVGEDLKKFNQKRILIKAKIIMK